MADTCFPITTNFNQCDGTIQSSNFELELSVLIGVQTEIKTKTRDAINPTIYNSIVMQTGKKMVEGVFRLKNPLDEMATTSEDKGFAITGKVEGELVIYGRNPDAAYAKMKLDNNRLFIIAKQASQTTGNARYLVIGAESGLRPAAGDNFQKTKGGYVYKFIADFLSYPEEFLYTGNDATTDAMIAALKVPGV
jgi:hypothetical protein